MTVAELGQMLGGRYKLIELLGQGGMATIFHGQDTELGRDVAVKVLRSEYGRDQAFVARFRAEAQSAASLSHPNIVNVFDYGMEKGDPFIVMELLDGGDLAAVMHEQGALDQMAAARIAQQIFDALDAAHGQGIVHRDIKPTNVLLTRAGRVKVTDFGIARAFSEAQLTMPGTTLGSVHYFSPEQARGELVTSASDVYSAGLVLFEMLTGRRAWTGDSAGAVAVARLAGDPPAPSSLRSGISPALDIIVRRALARVASDRPTAGELSTALGRFIADPARASAIASGAAAGDEALLPAAGAAAAPPPRGPYAAPLYADTPRYGTTGRPRAARRPIEEDEDRNGGGGAWGWIAAILGVLVLLAGGVLLFVLLSGRPAPQPTPTPAFVDLPNLVGNQVTDAQSMIDRLGLIMTVGAYQLTDQASEGEILTQDPPPGQVQRGTRVTVTVATRRTTVTVPDVKNRTEVELVSILLQNDLVPGTRSEEYSADVPATLVVRTNPRIGIEVARGTTIDYVLSLGPAPTPTPTPEPTPTPSPTPSPPPPPPSPTPTPPPVTVGNYSQAVCTITLGSAKAKINDDHLTVGGIFSASNSSFGSPDDGWLVVDQYPAQGAKVAPGTAVSLLVKSTGDVCP
jgi:beta-lactam-binding protein with PASTA domain